MKSPIFILSHPRSGSTLLRYLLDTHPDICSPVELRFGALCELLTVAFELIDVSEEADLEPAWERRVAHFGTTRRILETIMEDYCRDRSKSRWCEKTPSNTEHLDYLNAVFSDAQYICLHRSALDCAKSNLDLRRRDFDREDETAVVTREIEAWCRTTERLVAHEIVHGRRILRVRYEDMVTDTEEQLNRIWTFLDVPRPASVTRDVFRAGHDAGPGDPKVTGSTEIRTDRIGPGLTLDIAAVGQSLRERVIRLLDQLGY